MPVDFARASFAVSEYRKTSARQDPTVKIRDPLATELEFNSLLESEADANALGDYILALRKVNGRNNWNLAVKAGALDVEIGDTITVVYPRFGLQDGKNFIVKRIKKAQASLFDEFTLFGPQ